MLRFLLALFFILGALAATAGQEVQVYRAEALVTSQAAAERNKAARTSLAEVIVRVSGNGAALEHPNVRQALTRAQTYVYEYSYASTDQQIEVDGRLVPATRVIFQFAPQAIEQLLRDSGLSLWPANRPTLLVWAAFRDQEGVIHRIPEEDVRQALHQQADLRGVPLLMPAHDFEDHLALPTDDLWSGDTETIKIASERYRPDAILIGRYTQSDQTWSANWELVHGSGHEIFSTQGAHAPELFMQALNASADYFARLYSVAPGTHESGAVVMRIDNVRDFANYKNVERYLQELAVVSHVELLVTESQRILVRLQLAGDLPLLLTTLELGKKLFPDTSQSVKTLNVTAYTATPQARMAEIPPAEEHLEGYAPPAAFAPALGTEANPLHYRWQP